MSWRARGGATPGTGGSAPSRAPRTPMHQSRQSGADRAHSGCVGKVETAEAVTGRVQAPRNFVTAGAAQDIKMVFETRHTVCRSRPGCVRLSSSVFACHPPRHRPAAGRRQRHPGPPSPCRACLQLCQVPPAERDARSAAAERAGGVQCGDRREHESMALEQRQPAFSVVHCVTMPCPSLSSSLQRHSTVAPAV